MKHLLCTCILAVVNLFPSFSQEITVSSHIVDSQGIAIPFVAVGIVEKGFGTVTFEDGSFTLAVKSTYMEDSLIISAVGYDKVKMAYSDFVKNKPESIVLNESLLMLSEITVVPTKIKFSKMGIAKKSSSNNFSINAPLEGATIATLFDEIIDPVLIKEVSVLVGKRNMEAFQLRCRIFAVDQETGLPGDDLLMKNMIQTGSSETELMVFALQEDLWIEQPFFVGFEWVATRKQFEQMQRAEAAFDTKFLSEIIDEHPGLTYNIRDSKKVYFFDEQNKQVDEVELNDKQTDTLLKKRDASPQLSFKIKVKGDKTYYGSPLIGNWSRLPHEAYISVTVGREVK